MRQTLPLLMAALLAPACGGNDQTPVSAADEDSFVAGEGTAGKFDTGYQTSLDAVEVEMTLEGDVKADGYSIERAPLDVGQFALTWLRDNANVYIQSLAEDYANGAEQVEWLVDGKWVSLKTSPETPRSKLSHFRLNVVNAVVVHPGDVKTLEGRVYEPIVPVEPGTLFDEVKDACGYGSESIPVGQDVYWYLWDPSKPGCNAETAKLKATVAKVLPKGGTTYPEYDRMTADKKIEVVVLFGQVDHGEIASSDPGFALQRSFEAALKKAKFAQDTKATMGHRFTRTQAGLTEVVDVWGPREFAGLQDYAHVANFDQAVNSHEVIIFNGHSVLGGSDFWSRQQIYRDPSKYQIFIYNGCLGYEYYINPILAGKKSWDAVDVVANVLPTPFNIVVQETSRTTSMLMWGAEHGGKTSWQQILEAMNEVGEYAAIYGASGVRTNKFQPAK